MPIIAFAPDPETRRRMSLLWGCIPRELPALGDTDALVDWVRGLTHRRVYASAALEASG